MDNCWLGIVVYFAGIISLMADGWQRVAYDDAGMGGKQPHLVLGEDRQIDLGGVGPELATMVSGARVEFLYAGLNVKAKYRVTMRFLADGAKTLRVKAGEEAVLATVELQPNRVQECTVEISPKSYENSELCLVLEAVKGGDAVVSEVWVDSDDCRALDVGRPAGLPHELQRLAPQGLTPRPAETGHRMSLNGQWSFQAVPKEEFWAEEKPDGAEWKPIQVPGEWVMQGYEVPKNQRAAYRKAFVVPQSWQGRRCLIRFDAVHSACKVWINGRAVGEHVGAFLPFEFDVTDFLKEGENRVDLAVCNESLADTLSKGSHYANHAIGGILRKVELVSVPQVHLSGMEVNADLAENMREAVVEVSMSVKNTSAEPSSVEVFARMVPVGVMGEAVDASRGAEVVIGKVSVPTIAVGQSIPVKVSAKVTNPELWHAESPFLYQVEILVKEKGREIERLTKQCGFRRVEVRNRQLTVNGKPVKLKGVCRHSVHPTLGRALTPEWILRDAEIFKAANCNFIRTSHYPAEEEFLDLCDQLGMFVMDEAPFCWCWDGWGQDSQVHDYLCRTQLELVQRDRHRPSVIIWSLANESKWSPAVEKAASLVKLADPSRMVFFSHSEYFGTKGQGLLDIGTWHYPEWQHLKKYESYFRPMVYDEWAHVNAYNEREILTDPGIRDLWGRPVEAMWNEIRGNRNSAGVAVWCGIDEKFFIKDKPVGYGPWGIVDGWRREKPEYWHLKKTYSPVRILIDEWKEDSELVVLPIENRYDIKDFSNLKFDWTCAGKAGTVRSDVPAHQRGVLVIPVGKQIAADSTLEVVTKDSMGRVLDQHRVIVKPTLKPSGGEHRPNGGKPLRVEETMGGWQITAEGYRIQMNRDNGKFSVTADDEKVMVLQAPELLVLASDNSRVKVVDGVPVALEGHENDASSFFSSSCTDWKVSSVVLEKQSADQVEYFVTGKYAEASGWYRLIFTADGCEVQSEFTVENKVSPRQIGWVFQLPKSFQTLSWKRNGEWSVYPANHIARSEGTAIAYPQPCLPDLNGPHQQPTWDWSQDTLVFGSNDFRSTKHHILSASLKDDQHHEIRVISDGVQHSRCWLDQSSTHWLIASYSTQGAEQYFRMMSDRERISYDPNQTKAMRTIQPSVKMLLRNAKD